LLTDIPHVICNKSPTKRFSHPGHVQNATAKRSGVQTHAGRWHGGDAMLTERLAARPRPITLTDSRGEQGMTWRTYLTWRLPNPHPTGSKARRLNTQLAGLCHQRDAGNGRLAGRRRYFADGAAAAKAWGQAGGRLWAYWPGNGRATGVCLWYGLEGRAG